MKEKLIKLAKKKGFTSSFLYNTPYHKLIHKESIRWYFWLNELKQWFEVNHNIDVEPYLVKMEHNGVEVTQNLGEKEYSYKLVHKGITQYITDLDYKETSESALEVGLLKALDII